MRLLLILLISSISMNEIIIFDFNKTCKINSWKTINDGVMGGVSTSSMSLNEENKGVFSGTVSTENNGGFAMVRLPVSIFLNENSKKIKLRVKGDGKQYQFRIKSTDDQKHRHVKSFNTTNDWETITLDLNDFEPFFRGNRLRRSNFSSDKIKEIAILIGNKRDENFKLLIDSIKIVE